MATLMKRNSENLEPNVEAPCEVAIKAPSTENASVLRFNELMAAWGEGRFNMPETVDDAVSQFFAHDLVVDVATAHAHVDFPPFKLYDFGSVKDWFAFLGGYEIADIVSSAVASSQDASEIWQRFTSKATSKVSGKSMVIEMVNVIQFEGNLIKSMTTIYSDPVGVAALDSIDSDISLGPPVAAPFEPHPEPKIVFTKAFEAWGSGAFAAAETKDAAFAKHMRTDAFIDASSAVLPDVFKTYRGFSGVDEWANVVIGEWEFMRFEMAFEAGLRPGCILQKLDVDVKHKVTGKEAKGIVLWAENAYDADGKMVYGKQFWANPAVAASLY